PVPGAPSSRMAPGAREALPRPRAGGPRSFASRVAPRPAAASRIADPLLADAEPAHDAAGPVRDNQFAVVPREVGNEVERLERMESPDVHSPASEPAPIPPPGGRGSRCLTE